MVSLKKLIVFKQAATNGKHTTHGHQKKPWLKNYMKMKFGDMLETVVTRKEFPLAKAKKTLEKEMNAAIAEIEALSSITGKVSRIRLETLG